MTTRSARAIVNDVLGPSMTREIWTSSYNKALPISVQDFDLSAVLPAVFYMFRFGVRRGKGTFLETFGDKAGAVRERRRSATIARVATKMAQTPSLQGFEDETSQAILGDLLLCFCLENNKRALGREEQIQRVTPAHYMASWIDLPDSVVNLRFVPETIVAMLADQSDEYVRQNDDESRRTWFAVGRGFEDNVLLKAFHQGMVREGKLGDRASDRFEEETLVGLDQLLMIRLAQHVGAAPEKLRGGEGERISNQQPIAEQATRDFSEDIRRFVRDYADVIPRHAFVELMESCMAIGLTTILSSVIEILFTWSETGVIRNRQVQAPTQLFVDCSNGVDRNLRALAEQSMDDYLRRIERFPTILMALRLLDYSARYDRDIKKLDVKTRPYATEWLNLLGDIMNEQRPEAQAILYDLERKSAELAEQLKDDYPEMADMLRNDQTQANPVWRLADTLTALQGRKATQSKLIDMIGSVLLETRPNGLAMKRNISRQSALGTGPTRREIRSLVLTDSALDYLVHCHVLPNGNKDGYRLLSFQTFVQILYKRYGFCIDRAPNGMAISNERLQQNRLVLERRLRDLGLLVGVNDAESMKQLKPRFERPERETHGAY